MTGMGRPKHFEPPSKWSLAAVAAFILACAILRDLLAPAEFVRTLLVIYAIAAAVIVWALCSWYVKGN